MMPPTSIDGTDITGATIDGTDVQEITVDGQTVFTAGFDIPQSVVAHFDPSQESFADGDVVTTATDQSGAGNDLTGSGVIYKTNIQNGEPLFRYDGSNDFLDRTSFNISQPFTIAIVVVSIVKTSGAVRLVSRASSSDPLVGIEYSDVQDSFQLRGSGSVRGSDTQAPVILTGVADGSNSIIRENGTQTGSGDAGNDGFSSLSLGSREQGLGTLDGDLGECLIYDSDLRTTNELTTEENRLSAKYNITI